MRFTLADFSYPLELVLVWKLANEDIVRGLMLRSVVGTVSGTFIITLATYAALASSGRFDYLLVTGASTLATALVGVGMKPGLLGGRYVHRDWPMPFLVGLGGAVLGVEALILATAFPSAVSVLYAMCTLAGCSLTLWGNYVASTMRFQIPLAQTGIAEKMLTP